MAPSLSIIKLFLLSTLCALTTTCRATNDTSLACPEQVSEPSLIVKEVREGWKPFVASPLYLHSVAPTDGPPERLGQLKGQHVSTGRNSWTDTYELRGSFPEGKWLQCSYGMLNEIVLSKRLDDSITSCTIKGKRGEKAGQNVFSVTCR